MLLGNVLIVFVNRLFTLVCAQDKNGKRIQGAASCETISCKLAGGRECRSETLIYTVISLFIFSGLQPAHPIWYTFDYRCRSLLLDAYHPRVKQGNCHGVGNKSNYNIWASGATFIRLVMQLLAGSKIIEVDNSVREDRALL